MIASPRWKALAAQGARPQRLLWASTSTKNPAYSDTMYVEPLIGPETVNTMPMETIEAYRDHGEPAARVVEGIDEAQRDLERLAAAGIDLEAATRELERQGVKKFVEPYDELLAALEGKRRALGASA